MAGSSKQITKNATNISKEHDMQDIIIIDDSEEDEEPRQKQNQQGRGEEKQQHNANNRAISRPLPPHENLLANLLAGVVKKPQNEHIQGSNSQSTHTMVKQQRQTALPHIPHAATENKDEKKNEKKPPVSRKRPNQPMTTQKNTTSNTKISDNEGRKNISPKPSLTSNELWCIKHTPQHRNDLVVHKKKIEEIEQWFRDQSITTNNNNNNNNTSIRSNNDSTTGSKLLLVTGPPGCGKSITIHLLAQAFEYSIVEWQPQPHLTWDDVQYHQSYSKKGANIEYFSKLEAFQEFVQRLSLPTLSVVHESRSSPLKTLPTPFLPSGGAGHHSGFHHSQQKKEAGKKNKVLQTNDDNDDASRIPPALPNTSSNPPMKNKKTLIIIDDIPFTSSADQRQCLASCLVSLSRNARFPVIVVTTESTGRSQQDKSSTKTSAMGPFGFHYQVASALDRAKIPRISFNPLTALNIEKALLRVLHKERIPFALERVAAIAQQVDGDLRNALSTLQFLTTGIEPQTNASMAISVHHQYGSGDGAAPKRRRGAAKEQFQRAVSHEVDKVLFTLRDTSLSVFHGLGKLLYNKRISSRNDDIAMHDNEEKEFIENREEKDRCGKKDHQIIKYAAWTHRPSMDGFDPEHVIHEAGFDANSVIAFLHENIPSFIEDSAIDDLALCLDQLSVADIICTGGRHSSNRTESILMMDDGGVGTAPMHVGPMADAAGGSVAARGICFWNRHPSARQWTPLHGPTVYKVQKGMNLNMEELEMAVAVGRLVCGGAGNLETRSMAAVDVLPFLRSILNLSKRQNMQNEYGSVVWQQPMKWTRFWRGSLYEERLYDDGGIRNRLREEGSVVLDEELRRRVDEELDEIED